MKNKTSKVSTKVCHSRGEKRDATGSCPGTPGAAQVSKGRLDGGPSLKSGAAAVSDLSAAASIPILKQGKIVVPGAKTRRVVRVPVAMPSHLARAALVLPAVLDEIELNARLALVKAANAMIRHGISSNKTADALGIARSRLSVLRAAYERHGEDGLRTGKRKGGRQPARGRQHRNSAFLEFRLR